MINVLFQDEESPDIDFIYADSDNLGAELAELYSYTEQVLFANFQIRIQNQKCCSQNPNQNCLQITDNLKNS